MFISDNNNSFNKHSGLMNCAETKLTGRPGRYHAALIAASVRC
jgi:hypothetical protein